MFCHLYSFYPLGTRNSYIYKKTTSKSHSSNKTTGDFVHRTSLVANTNFSTSGASPRWKNPSWSRLRSNGSNKLSNSSSCHSYPQHFGILLGNFAWALAAAHWWKKPIHPLVRRLNLQETCGPGSAADLEDNVWVCLWNASSAACFKVSHAFPIWTFSEETLRNWWLADASMVFCRAVCPSNVSSTRCLWDSFVTQTRIQALPSTQQGFNSHHVSWHIIDAEALGLAVGRIWDWWIGAKKTLQWEHKMERNQTIQFKQLQSKTAPWPLLHLRRPIGHLLSEWSAGFSHSLQTAASSLQPLRRSAAKAVKRRYPHRLTPPTWTPRKVRKAQRLHTPKKRDRQRNRERKHLDEY